MSLFLLVPYIKYLVLFKIQQSSITRFNNDSVREDNINTDSLRSHKVVRVLYSTYSLFCGSYSQTTLEILISIMILTEQVLSQTVFVALLAKTMYLQSLEPLHESFLSWDIFMQHF